MQKSIYSIFCRMLRVLLTTTFFIALPVSAATDVPQLTIRPPLSSLAIPVVILGNELGLLKGMPVSKIRAFSWQGEVKKAIPFQIDKRDARGRYEFSHREDGSALMLGVKDECVFMTSDAGERKRADSEVNKQKPTIEIVIVDSKTGERKWVYLQVATADSLTGATKDYVAYDAARDVIETATYKLGFSKPQPFLIDSLQWHIDAANKWSQNVIDTMKIRHKGKLLGIEFVRTQADYRSRVLAVRAGPVRVIRRTLNSVKMVSFLQSPSVTIDYVAYANGFQMDAMIDLPFKLSWFFSDLTTYTTIDWADAPSLPALGLYKAGMPGFTINGGMTSEKEQFSKGAEQRFALQSAYGLLAVQLELEKGTPVESKLYLRDDRTIIDKPENIPGQFGNVGFITTGWEKVDTSLHHLVFGVLLLKETNVEQGLALLGHYPVKWAD
jgi:hypothetical protein